MNKKNFLIPVIIILLSCSLQAATDQFQEANKLYQQEEYQKALSTYQKLVNEGLNHEALEYNIASCYFRLDQPGLARLHFEKALRLSPGDEDTLYNIHFIESRYLKKTLREENFVTIDRFLWELVSTFPPLLTLWAGIVAFILLFLIITVKMLKPNLISPALRWTLTIVLAIVALISFSISFTREMLQNDHSYGIITVAGVNVMSEPDPDAHSRFPAPETIKVRIVRRQAGWLEIVLPNGSKGWVEEINLAVI